MSYYYCNCEKNIFYLLSSSFSVFFFFFYFINIFQRYISPLALTFQIKDSKGFIVKCRNKLSMKLNSYIYLAISEPGRVDKYLSIRILKKE